MKRYYQLLLVILSVVSVLCCVFYKHEYDRLRKVLEILDFFGNPSATTSSDVSAGEGSDRLSISSDFWHGAEDSFQIYASHKIQQDNTWKVNSLVVIRKNPGASRLRKRITCSATTADSTSYKHESTTEWTELSHDSQHAAYCLTCHLRTASSQLLWIEDKTTMLDPVRIPLHSKQSTSDLGLGTSLCVLPGDPYWQPEKLVEFLLYYRVLGTNNFYLYHTGVSDQVIAALNRLTARYNFGVQLLTWNRSPNAALDLALVQSDCTFRTGGAAITFTLPSAHYLVLSKGSTIADWLATSQFRLGTVYEAEISVQSNCTGHPKLLPSNPKRVNLGGVAPPVLVRWSFGSPSNQKLGVTEKVKVDSQIRVVVLQPCPVQSSSTNQTTDETLSRFSAIFYSVRQKSG